MYKRQVYPGNLSSLRFEKLRDGLEEFEKVNILRARAAKNPKAKAAVARMGIPPALADPHGRAAIRRWFAGYSRNR